MGAAMTGTDPLELLAARAARVQTLLHFASRPFVLEFAGSPKAGKSTSVDAIEHFLRRNRFRTHILRERASFCPIPMKGHVFFNIWCACTMLAEMLENVDSTGDIIIKDRGLFDTLLWLQRQLRRGEVTSDEVDRIERFLLMERWTRLVDLVIVMTVNPDEAIKREHEPRISNVRGSIMNEAALASINDALRGAMNKYSHNFSTILSYDTTGAVPKEVNIRIANDILDKLELFLDPRIMVVDSKILRKIIPESDGCFSFDNHGDILAEIKKHCSFIKRSEAEDSDAVVQVIPCALLMYSGKVFLFERMEKDPKVELHGKSTIWQGAHVAYAESDFDVLINDALSTKLRDKLFLNRRFDVNLLGYAWDQTNPKSLKHIGLLFKLVIDSDDVAADLQKKAFRSGRGHGLNGEFLTAAELREKADELSLEPWSLGALRAGVGGALDA
jgi:predicted NUDIX family phosphoesterase